MTGQQVSLETDVDQETFSIFTSFNATKFFANNFDRGDELLTGITKEEKIEEVSWWE